MATDVLLETAEYEQVPQSVLETDELTQVGHEDTELFASKYNDIIGTGMETTFRNLGIKALDTLFAGIDLGMLRYQQHSLIDSMQRHIQFGIDAGCYSSNDLPEKYKGVLNYPARKFVEA